MSQLKRTALMRQYADAAKAGRDSRDQAGQECASNLWFRLATPREISRAPQYLTWTGRAQEAK